MGEFSVRVGGVLLLLGAGVPALASDLPALRTLHDLQDADRLLLMALLGGETRQALPLEAAQ